MSKYAIALAALAVALPVCAHAQDASVNVTVNGQPVNFDQPPVVRVGRVFVPLRGVFERLGATVVYQGGHINATRGRTTVALQVGSQTAIVNGASTTLDSAPFQIGERVLVPLRFVAQALGAGVTYDGGHRVVAINGQMQPVAAPPPAVLTPAPTRLVRFEPESNATVTGLRPQIGATFPRAVDPNGVRVRVDGRDVTADTYISPRAFSYDPDYDLPYGQHVVRVSGAEVAASWAFVNQPAPNPNFLRDVSPPNGTRVGDTFTIQGYTQPGSRVHIVVQSAGDIGFGETATSTVTVDSGADPNGHFARQIRVENRNGTVVDVRLESHAPDGTVAVRTLRLRP